MGQAKNRGNFEQRIIEAQQRKAVDMGASVSLEEIIKRHNLPDDSEFKGYVVNLPESDEFLMLSNESSSVSSRIYSRSPETAKIYENFKEAAHVANSLSKFSRVGCVIVAGKKIYVVYGE